MSETFDLFHGNIRTLRACCADLFQSCWSRCKATGNVWDRSNKYTLSIDLGLVLLKYFYARMYVALWRCVSSVKMNRKIISLPPDTDSCLTTPKFITNNRAGGGNSHPNQESTCGGMKMLLWEKLNENSQPLSQVKSKLSKSFLINRFEFDIIGFAYFCFDMI